MDRIRAAGAVVAVLSLIGYGAGVVAAYPGREASIVGLMVGITLVAIGE